GPGGSCGATDDAPYRLGRLVIGRARARAGGDLCGAVARSYGSAAGAADPIRRLRRLAARAAARRRAGAPAGVLAAAAGRPGDAGPADRSPAPADPALSRRGRGLHARPRVEQPPEGVEPARRSDAVHDPAGGL